MGTDDQGMTEAERRQLDFDARMGRLIDEGRAAQRGGVAKEDCPYTAPAESQMRTAWIGGWAEAALGIDEEMEETLRRPG